MSPVISVIVPVYNAIETLARCVDSILAQTCKDIEIILVDDGSRDSSGTLCKEYEREFENITAVLRDNGGVSAARNAGIAVASGRYLGFVDSDDWIRPEMFEALLAAIFISGDYISACGYSIHRYDGTVIDNMVDPDTPARLELQQALYSLIHPHGIQGFLCNKLFDTELLKELGGGTALLLDERILVCEDLLYVSRCIEAAGTVAYDNRPMYVYCVRDYGGAANYNRNQRTSELMALEQLVASWHTVSPELGDYIKRKYTDDAYSILRSAAAAGDREYIPILRDHLRLYLRSFLRQKNVTVTKKLRVILALMLPNLENKVKSAVRKR